MLTDRTPGLKVRNLGWSGDDVHGVARRAFEVDDPNIGRKRLVDLTLAEKPTVDPDRLRRPTRRSRARPGCPLFKKGLEELLDARTNWPPGERPDRSDVPAADGGPRPLHFPTRTRRTSGWPCTAMPSRKSPRLANSASRTCSPHWAMGRHRPAAC